MGEEECSFDFGDDMCRRPPAAVTCDISVRHVMGYRQTASGIVVCAECNRKNRCIDDEEGAAVSGGACPEHL